jgi:prepilin-type N-terminal cleavage/methylation domain-containing protein
MPRMPRDRRNHRPGLTFIEIVVAVALLGVVSAAMFGVTSFAAGMQLRQQRMLACTEVANRLMLQYLDEPTKMPEAPKVAEYGPVQTPSHFRWEYREEPIELIEANADARDQSHSSTLPTDRFRQVTIRVWLSEDSGGSRFPDESTPTAVLSRMIDPLYPRNPDSFMNMLNDPAGFQQFMGSMMGFQGNTVSRGGLPGGQNQNGQRGGRNGQGRGQGGPGGINPGQAFNRGPGRGGFPGGNFGGRGGPGGTGNARPTDGAQPITRPGGRGN